MQDLTLPQLQAACSDAGLSRHGNREELLERLNAHAAASLSESVVIPTEAPDVVEDDGMLVADTADADAAHSHKLVAQGAVKHAVSSPAVIMPTLADEQHLATRPMVKTDEVKRLVADINTKYGDRMKCQFDPAHEVYEFTGGLQGKYVTTVHQDAGNVLNRDGIKGAADQYAKIAREALFHARTPQGAIGDLAGMN